MYFPKFWAKGSANGQFCWHWSDVSFEDAERLAQQSALKQSTRFNCDTRPPPSQYWYSNRPLREPVLEEIRNAKSEVLAIITRNRHGTKVLNVSNIAIIDVDGEKNLPPGLFERLIGSLFGRKSTTDEAPSESAIMERASEWCRSSPSSGFRIYRTKAGHRIVVTHDLIDPESARAERLFAHFKADPRYQRLCRIQKSFRARLTPKPWRCGAETPIDSWPFPNSQQEASFLEWERDYYECSQSFSTCALVGVVGSTSVHDEIAPIVELHDRLCKVRENLPLA